MIRRRLNRTYCQSTCQDCGDKILAMGGRAKKRCVECEHAAKLARDRARTQTRRDVTVRELTSLCALRRVQDQQHKD